MKTYLVGGAVRDSLLNRPIKDKDYVVVGATPKQMLAAGYQQVGKDFPVFLHPKTKEEYALARTERKTGQGYHGFTLDFSSEVTLEEDLQRRDLTVNAMAQDATGNIIDPYHGLQDIENKKLRHVSLAFTEDPLRVLRVARFAARYAYLGFTVAEETLCLMQQLADSGELTTLTAERVWQETENALGEKDAAVFFEVLHHAQALTSILPEIAAAMPYTATKTSTDNCLADTNSLGGLKQACKMEASTVVRFAVLLQMVNKTDASKTELINTEQSNTEKSKPNTQPKQRDNQLGNQLDSHPENALDAVKAVCTRLKVPKAFAQLAIAVCQYHKICDEIFEQSAQAVMQLIHHLDGLRNPKRLADFSQACACLHTNVDVTNADIANVDIKNDDTYKAAYPQAKYLQLCLDAVNGVSINDIPEKQRQEMIANGEGKAIATTLMQLRINAIACIDKTCIEKS